MDPHESRLFTGLSCPEKKLTNSVLSSLHQQPLKWMRIRWEVRTVLKDTRTSKRTDHAQELARWTRSRNPAGRRRRRDRWIDELDASTSGSM